MNWNQVEGNWEQFKGKVQTQWGKLTGDDLDVIKGKRTELSGKIQERYGKVQEDADKEVDEWVERYRVIWEQRLDRLDDYLKELQEKEKRHGRKR